MEQKFVLCRSDQGDGGWSLHEPGSTDYEIATGAAPALITGTAEMEETTGTWNHPNHDDYNLAKAMLAQKQQGY